jgi:hypothetical protein
VYALGGLPRVKRRNAFGTRAHAAGRLCLRNKVYKMFVSKTNMPKGEHVKGEAVHSLKRSLGFLLRQTASILMGLGLCAGSAAVWYFIFTPHPETQVIDDFLALNLWATVLFVPGAMLFSFVLYIVLGMFYALFWIGITIIIWSVAAWEVPWYGTTKLDEMRAKNPQDWQTMKSGRKTRTALSLCLILLLVLGGSWGVWTYSVQASNEPVGGIGNPRIWFTHVPSIGSSGDLQGEASHVTVKDYCVAVYIRVGEGWWTKPTFAQPTVTLQWDGRWVCDITTGGKTDLTATEIAAYLIPKNYSPPAMSGQSTLPAEFRNNSVADCKQTRNKGN